MGRAKRVRRARQAARRKVIAAGNFAMVADIAAHQVKAALLAGEPVDLESARALDRGTMGEHLLAHPLPPYRYLFRRVYAGWLAYRPARNAQTRARRRKSDKRKFTAAFDRAEHLVNKRRCQERASARRRVARLPPWLQVGAGGLMSMVGLLRASVAFYMKKKVPGELEEIRMRIAANAIALDPPYGAV